MVGDREVAGVGERHVRRERRDGDEEEREEAFHGGILHPRASRCQTAPLRQSGVDACPLGEDGDTAGAIWRGQWLRRIGFQLLAFNGQGHEDTGETQDRYWNLVPSSGPSFVVRRRTDSSSYAEFVLKDASATLVDEVEQGTTYLFLARIEIGAAANGHDLASALCVPVGDWDWNGKDEPDWTLVRADTGFTLATAQTPDMLTLYGAYETGSVPVSFDEIMLATKLSEAVPNTHPGLVIIVR